MTPAALLETPTRSPAELRTLRALLTWRMRRILRALPRREQRAIRLVPALLHASFPTLDLRQTPPGVEGLSSPKRAWLSMGRGFGLPAPIGTQRHRKTIRAILAIPNQGRIELQVVPIPGVRQPEIKQIVDRCKVAEGIFQRQGISLSLQLAPPLLDETGLRLFLFGGLLAGGLPSLDWDALSVRDPETLARLIEWSPSSLTAAALLFLRPGTTSSAALTFFRAHARGHSAALLSDPELFCAAWVSRNRPEGKLPLEAVRAASRSAPSRRAASAWVQTPAPSGAISLALLGRRLSVAAAHALRRYPLAASLPLRRILQRELLTASGLPGCLQEPFERSLQKRQPMHAAELIALGGGSTSSHLETRLIRGLALLGPHAIRLGSELEPPWPQLAAQLQEPGPGRRFLLSIEIREVEGPPLDPLNRGLRRENTLRNGLVVELGGERRPTARRVTPFESATELLAAAARGMDFDVTAESPAAEPAASRLLRLAGRVAGTAAGDGPPLAIELGGKVLLLGDPEDAGEDPGDLGVALFGPGWEREGLDPDEGLDTPGPSFFSGGPTQGAGRVGAAGASGLERRGAAASELRLFSLRRFSSRPRRYVPDPEAPDLGAVEGYAGAAPPGTLDCLVLVEDGPLAVVFTTDAAGFRLREEIPLERLDAHLAEARRLLREAPTPLALTLRVVGSRWKPHALPPEAPPIPVAVEGDLMHGLHLTLVGDHFGRVPTGDGEPAQQADGSGPALGGGFTQRRAQRKGWEAAAATLLSVWPVTSHPVVSFPTFGVRLQGRPLSGLCLLYARSVVRRRLDLHIRRMIHP